MKQIMDEAAIGRSLRRMSHEIIERNQSLEEVILVGVQTRGEPLARRIQANIAAFEGVTIPVELLDVTFYRDDLSRLQREPLVKNPAFTHKLNNKRLVIVDDVLFTGRTVRAAMDALLSNQRPKQIQLAVLIDRGHRELPIRPDFVGKNVPTSQNEQVQVKLQETDGEESVFIQERA